MIYTIVPAFNEEEKISFLLRDLHRTLEEEAHQLIVVDDGSADHTIARVQSVAKRLPIVLLRHSRNLGPGAAFRTGITYTLRVANQYDIVLTLESDQSSDPSFSSSILRVLKKERADVVIAGCYAPGGTMKNVPLSRRILSRAANTFLMLLFPINGVWTYSGFCRAYRISTLCSVFEKYGEQTITDDGFFSVVELLVKLSRMPGIVIREIPMTLTWSKGRQSKMRIIKTIKSHLVGVINLKRSGL